MFQSKLGLRVPYICIGGVVGITTIACISFRNEENFQYIKKQICIKNYINLLQKMYESLGNYLIVKFILNLIYVHHI